MRANKTPEQEWLELSQQLIAQRGAIATVGLYTGMLAQLSKQDPNLRRTFAQLKTELKSI